MLLALRHAAADEQTSAVIAQDGQASAVFTHDGLAVATHCQLHTAAEGWTPVQEVLAYPGRQMVNISHDGLPDPY